MAEQKYTNKQSIIQGSNSGHTAKIGEAYAVDSDEISLKELILKLQEWYRYLLTKRKIILTAGIIGGALGFGHDYLQKLLFIT